MGNPDKDRGTVGELVVNGSKKYMPVLTAGSRVALWSSELDRLIWSRANVICFSASVSATNDQHKSELESVVFLL